MWPIMGAKSQNYDTMILVTKYCLAESTVFGQKFLFFCRGNLLAESEVTPFLDPVGGGGGLGEESIELLSYLIRYY